MVGVFLAMGLVTAVVVALGWVADLGFRFEGGYAYGWDLILWMGCRSRFWV